MCDLKELGGGVDSTFVSDLLGKQPEVPREQPYLVFVTHGRSAFDMAGSSFSEGAKGEAGFSEVHPS